MSYFIFKLSKILNNTYDNYLSLNLDKWYIHTHLFLREQIHNKDQYSILFPALYTIHNEWMNECFIVKKRAIIKSSNWFM